jgi:hypothetical protein
MFPHGDKECLVDRGDPPRHGPLSWSVSPCRLWRLFSRLLATLLSRCSGSDDTSPSSSLLPLCECILLPPRGATPSVSSSSSFSACAAALSPVSGSKLLAFVVDTGEAYPQAPSEAVLWIPLSGVAPMF